MHATMQSICWVIGGVACMAVLDATGWWGDWHIWLKYAIGGVPSAVALLNIMAQPLQTRYEFAFDHFLIGDYDIRIRQGWLLHTTIKVPYNRVQHVATSQGPVMRHYDLVAVEIHTATSKHSIEALEPVEAERLVDLISERVRVSKEDL